MPTRLTVLPNGSLRVQGEDFEIVDKDGNPYGLGGRDTVSLCRCGQSKKMPFCDGSHKGLFQDEARAFDLPPKPTPPAPPPATGESPTPPAGS